MNLANSLTRAGVITGPLFDSNTSHSSLDRAKKFLFGQPQFTGKEGYLHFGNYLHTAFASYPRNRVLNCTIEEAKKLTEMLTKLYEHKIVLALVRDSIREEAFYVNLGPVRVKMILDVKQVHSKTGSDLKTTDCKTYSDFLAKAKEYGYFRQADTYMLGAGLKEFYFIGICKEPPFEIFILRVNDYRKEMAYAREELEFLLYWYQVYGKIIK